MDDTRNICGECVFAVRLEDGTLKCHANPPVYVGDMLWAYPDIDAEGIACRFFSDRLAFEDRFKKER